MGCIDEISYERFPVQKSEFIGRIVEVCYHYDTKHTHKGVIVLISHLRMKRSYV